MRISYGQDLADDLARQSRDLMSRPFYEALFDTRISPDKDSVRQFETIGGGRRISSSTSGAVTGRGADFIIIDDPLKADEALSESARRSLNTWHDNTLRSRLNNQQTGAIIIVMQRLHSDDLVAHVLIRIHRQLRSAASIAKVAEVCAESGNITGAVKMMMDIEDPAYRADRMLKAVLLIRNELCGEIID